MDINNLITRLATFKGSWLRVNDELCVHCFMDDLYVILCKYTVDGTSIIRVDVDDIEIEDLDIIKEDYNEGTDIYSKLLPIYESAKLNASPASRKAKVA